MVVDVVRAWLLGSGLCGLAACALPGSGSGSESGTGIAVEAIHHAGLVVTDLDAATRFYVDVLGLRPHPARATWLVLGEHCALHLIPRRDAAATEPPHHAFRHVALRVADLRAALRTLLAHGVRVRQIAFDGSEREVAAPDDPLDFGIGSLFVHDPDGNLIELLQPGHGIFAAAR
jgi:catechol 2,3-dioxygenase-like lactoylglutathione lyase family enzyme